MQTGNHKLRQNNSTNENWIMRRVGLKVLKC